MNRNHSFPARCLAMLLALVLVLSNANLGLVTHALAAENGNLFDLIAASECGTEKMNAVLDYADALNNLNDETVEYAEAPAAADATLRQGVLTVKTVDGWVPYTYTVNGTKTAFGDSYAVNVGENTNEASVVYKLDLNKDEAVADALELIADLAEEAAQQAEALDKISGSTALAALSIMDYYFIEDMVAAVDALDYEDLGVEENQDLNEDGKINELDQAIAEKALEEVKAEYKQIIAQMMDRLVDEDDPYYEYKNSKGKPAYEDYLRVYAMLKEYKKDDGGLAHFYQNADDIVAELEILGGCLYDILGDYDAETHEYANTAVVNALLVEMEYDDSVAASDLAEMASRMINAAKTLKTLTAYKSEINTNSADLVALCNALVACGSVSDYSTDLCLYSKSLTVKDDSWKYVTIALEGTEIELNWKAETDDILDEQDIAAICDYIKTNAPYYTVDTTKVEALIGTKMTDNVTISCAAELSAYSVDIKDLDGNVLDTILVPGDATSITLPVKEYHQVTYKVNGETKIVTEATKVPVDMEKVAAGTFEIIVVEDINLKKGDMQALVDELNAQIGAGSFELKEENGEYVSLTANIEINDLTDFGMIVIKNGSNIDLNNEKFIYEEAGEIVVRVQALIDALLNDETFSNVKLINMGEGKENNLLNATVQLYGYDMDFELNLTVIPEKMATVSKGLKAIDEYVWFQAKDGVLDVCVDLPEKVYEAYLTAAIGASKIDDDNVAVLNNTVAMQFVADYFELLVNSDVNTTTFTNTLSMIGIEKDLTGYEEYYQMLKNAAAGEGFTYNISEKVVDVSLAGDKYNVEAVLDLLGIDSKNLDTALKFISEDPITASAVVNIVNEVPDFQALVVDPSKLNDAGYRSKISAIDYTTDLVGKVSSIEGSALVVLLDDVNGSLNFPSSVVLDLNGKTVNGSISANGKIIIVDSALDTYNGGAVTGSVSAAGGAITGGTYGSNVSSFLKDGYIQDNGSVRNALYYVVNENGTFNYVLNADFYQSCDGYLPSVKALAVELAADVAMNSYPAVALAYGSNNLYSLNIDAILDSYLGGGRDGAVDAFIADMVGSVYADGINTLANDIIDDLCDFKALSAALNNGETLCSYSFTARPIDVNVMHVADGNYIDVSLTARASNSKSFGIALTIDGENEYYTFAKELFAAMAEIVTVDAQVNLEQPVYDAAGNTLSVAGDAYANVTIDLSGNSDYTKGLAIILAYGNDEWADEIANAKNCVVELNKIIAQMSVEDVFTALKEMNREVSMTEMADAIGYKYSAEEIQNLEDVYHVVLCGLGKALEELDVTGNNNPLSTYADGVAAYTYSKTVDRSGDATVKGYTGVYDVTSVSGSITIKLAPKCTRVLGDADWDGVVTSYDAALILEYKAQLIDETGLHMCVCDVDGDGAVTSYDAACILEYKALLIDRFPAEEN